MIDNTYFEGMIRNLYVEAGLELDKLPEVLEIEAVRDKLVDEIENGRYDFDKRSIENDIVNVGYGYASAYFQAGFIAGMKFQQWINK